MTTGSFINNMMGTPRDFTPEVGMGATRLMWTDRRAATVVAVHTTKAGKPNRIVVQEDKVTRTDSHGMSDAQSYDYEPDPTGPMHTYTLRKNGQWVREGDPMRGGERVALGVRRHYYDFSF